MAVTGPPAPSSVRKAREAIRERAFEIYNMYLDGLKLALANGDYETFQKGMQYLMAHIKDEDGVSLLEMDVDKPKVVEGSQKGPTIQIGPIGIRIEDIKQLPEPVTIEVKPVDDNTE